MYAERLKKPLLKFTAAVAVTELITGFIPQDQQKDVVLVGAGDIADCTRQIDEQTAQAVQDVLKKNKDATVFTVGDNVYPKGSTEYFEKCFDPTWGQFKESIKLPVIGNHEYIGSKTADGYFAYFGKAAGEKGKGYYAKDFGNWRIYALNSELNGEAWKAQAQWLKKDLQDHPAQFKAAFEHKPRISSGKEHGDDPKMQTFWDVLSKDKKTHLMINGHEHQVEVFAPQTPQRIRDDKNGIREVIIGSGGGRTYEFSKTKPNSEFHYNKTGAVLKLTLHKDGTYKGDILSTEKKVIYEFTNPRS